MQAKHNANLHRYADESIALQEKLDSLGEQITDKLEELKGIEARIKRFNDQYVEEKEVRDMIPIEENVGGSLTVPR